MLSSGSSKPELAKTNKTNKQTNLGPIAPRRPQLNYGKPPCASVSPPLPQALPLRPMIEISIKIWNFGPKSPKFDAKS